MKTFDKVIDVKQRSHRSWDNLKNAARKDLGLSYMFGTAKVERSSTHYLQIAVQESEMSASDILNEIEKRGLA